MHLLQVHDDPTSSPVDAPTQWPLRHLRYCYIPRPCRNEMSLQSSMTCVSKRLKHQLWAGQCYPIFQGRASGELP